MNVAQLTHVVLRIVAGFLFMQHGGQKLFGWYGGIGGGDGGPAGPLPPHILLAGWLETVGGPLMMLGLFTRPVAFILSGEMAFAYFMSHFPRGLLPLSNHGEAATLFCFIWLFFAGNGSGGFSLDSVVFRRKVQRSPVPA